MESVLNLQLSSRRLAQDSNGHTVWQEVNASLTIPAIETALILCDVWDNHWSRGASERVNALAPRMNEVIRAARQKGVLIIHAPSDTMDFYTGQPARLRVLAAPPVDPPAPIEHADPPLPIDDSDGGSDTSETPWHQAWSRQHPAIDIDQDRDGISDDGREVYAFLRQRGIRLALIAGVHANLCILNRSFAIKQLVRWSIDVALVRDLTDAMYNPALRPYVSHDEGTRLVIEFIERFWAPSIGSEQLMM